MTGRSGAVLDLLRASGEYGMTWQDLAAARGMHHGSASGALSHLHRLGQAVRLAEKRNRCGVYVTPEFLGDRETVARRTNPSLRLDTGYQQGVTDGRQQLRGHLILLVDEMTRTAANGQGVLPHDRQCWQRHPTCALRAIRRALVMAA